MLIDITLRITPDMRKEAEEKEKKSPEGHLGTHFDVMDKEFPLEYTERKGILFDVGEIDGRDIDISDIDISKVEKDMFVVFHTGFIETEKYGTTKYFAEHPQLSHNLIDALIEKGISAIGVDFAGIRRGREHVMKDQYCADRGVFVIENLCNLKSLIKYNNKFKAHIYPMNYSDITGLPCRVIAEV